MPVRYISMQSLGSIPILNVDQTSNQGFTCYDTSILWYVLVSGQSRKTSARILCDQEAFDLLSMEPGLRPKKL